MIQKMIKFDLVASNDQFSIFPKNIKWMVNKLLNLYLDLIEFD